MKFHNDQTMKPAPEQIAPLAVGLAPDGMKPAATHDLPTIAELAALAAALRQPPSEALKLWNASARELDTERKLRVRETAWQSAQSESVPMPKSFPVTNLEVVTMALPNLKGRTADAAKVFRAYIGLDANFTKLSKVEIHNPAIYVSAFRQFSRWWKLEYISKVRSAAGKNSGIARAAAKSADAAQKKSKKSSLRMK